MSPKSREKSKCDSEKVTWNTMETQADGQFSRVSPVPMVKILVQYYTIVDGIFGYLLYSG